MSISAPPHGGSPRSDAAGPARAELTPGTTATAADPEALIEEAWQLTRRRRRRRGSAIAAAAICGAVGVGIAQGALTSATSPRGATGGGVAVGSSGVPARFWYTRSVRADREPLPIVPRVMRAGQKPGPVPLVYFDVRTSIETWVGPDGTVRQRQIELSRRFASPADRRRWLAAGEALPGGVAGSDSLIAGDGLFPPSANVPAAEPGDPGDAMFTYHQLLNLPLDPARLRPELQHAVAALNRRELNAYVRPGPKHQQIVARLAARWARTQGSFSALTQILESPIPDRLRLALVHAVAGMRGVRAPQQRRAGRIVLIDTTGFPGSITIDARTGELAASDGATIIAQGPTSSIRSLPHGLTAIAGNRQVPAPGGVTVSPRSGTASTGFVIDIPRPAPSAGSASAPFLAAMMFGPTGPDCTFWNSLGAAAIIPAGRPATTQAAPIDQYSLLPTAIRRASWCPGRYQLKVTPLQLGRGASRELAGPSATYFTVGP